MNINSILKQEGIVVIRKIDAFQTNTIAKNIAAKLYNSFPNLNLNISEVFVKLSRLNMYVAELPLGLSKAKYVSFNDSIYFNKDFNFSTHISFAIHECLHYLQALKDSSGNIYRLGLYSLYSAKTRGMAINEAAVQLMTSIALDERNETVKYYNIDINTISPNSYPLQCALVNQMAYFTTHNTLFESTLNSNDNFKDIFIKKTSKKAYNLIEKGIEKILTYEDSISTIQLELQALDNTNNIHYLNEEIIKYKEKILELFFQTQNIILANCFNEEFEEIATLNDITTFQNRLYNYSTIIGTNENYILYNEYYRKMMVKLEEKRNAFNDYLSLSIIPYKEKNKVSSLFSKLSLSLTKIFKKKDKKVEYNNTFSRT